MAIGSVAVGADGGAGGARLAASLARRVPGLLAVLAHGAPVRGEAVPGAPLELLLVLRVPVARGRIAAWDAILRRRCNRIPLALHAIESYRLGWLRPSVFQQSLIAGSKLLWGEPAALAVIPRWRPDQLDPRLALDEQTAAEGEVAAGQEALAALRAAGALLIARRAYTARYAERAAALRRAWPEAPALEPAPPAAFVARAREILADWLFTWEGTGLSAAGIERYRSLRAAAAAAGAAGVGAAAR